MEGATKRRRRGLCEQREDSFSYLFLSFLFFLFALKAGHEDPEVAPDRGLLHVNLVLSRASLKLSASPV